MDIQKMSKDDRAKRVIARGEFSNHSHVLFGDIEFLDKCFKIPASPDYSKAVSLYDEHVAKISTLDKASPDFVSQKQSIQREYNDSVEKLDVVTARHILETNWVNSGASVWTEEHVHVPMKVGTVDYVPQIEFNPLNEMINKVAD